MVGIENAFGTAVEDAITQPPVDDPDHAPDARFGAVPPAQACRYRDLVENGAPFVRADVCGQSLAGFVHDTRLRARGSVLAGRVRRGLISPFCAAMPSSRLSAMRWARSTNSAAAAGGQTSRAVSANSSSQRSKCGVSIGSGRCAIIGWPW